MRYFWLLDGQFQNIFNFEYHPGFENLGDYQSKAQLGGHHLHVRPFYVHMPTSPRFLPRAAKPSIRRGCVKQVGNYTRKMPLPVLDRVPAGTLHLPAAAAQPSNLAQEEQPQEHTSSYVAQSDRWEYQSQVTHSNHMSKYYGHEIKLGLTQVVSTSSLFVKTAEQLLINLLSSSLIRNYIHLLRSSAYSLSTELNKHRNHKIAATPTKQNHRSHH